PTISGQGFIFDGTAHQSYLVSYTRKEDCPSHDACLPVEILSWKVNSTRVGDLLDRVRSDLGPEAVIEFGRDLLASLQCPTCCEDEPVFMSLGKVTELQGRCPSCGQPRAPLMFHSSSGNIHGLLDKTLGEIGVPPWDVLGG